MHPLRSFLVLQPIFFSFFYCGGYHQFFVGPEPVVHSAQTLPLPSDFRDPYFFAATPLPARIESEPYLRMIQSIFAGARLDPAAIHPESIISAFSYSQNVPKGEIRLTTEHGRAPWARDHELLFINLKAGDEPAPPARTIFVVDTSGSMGSVFGSVRAALREYVRRLRPGDSVGFVTYAGGEQMLSPVPGHQKGQLLAFIDSMEGGGFVTHSRGILIAYDFARQHFQAGAVNNVTVISDGDLRGIGVYESELAQRARTAWEKNRVRTSSLAAVHGGLPGNMEDLARAGNGSAAVLSSISSLRTLGMLNALPAAEDVSIRVSFDPGRISRFRMIAHEGTGTCLSDVRLDPLIVSGRNLYPGESVTYLFELVPANTEEGRALAKARFGRTRRPNDVPAGQTYVVKASFRKADGSARELDSRGLPVPVEKPSRDFRFASAVGGLGMILHESRYASGVNRTAMLDRMRTAVAEGSDPAEQEFASSAARALSLARKTSGGFPIPESGRPLFSRSLVSLSEERNGVCPK